jgi:glycosyltransferase involved in cell wall biosynthesis
LSSDSERNLVIYNGFDFSRLRGPHSPRVQDGNRPGAGGKTVGMVAEFNRNKDYLTFVEAARVIERTRPEVSFVAVGDGETLNACRIAAADVPAVQFLGRRKDVEALVETFDVGVLSTYVEGVSNTIMEYMAAGKPVVATDCGGTRELVVAGETGILVPRSDAGQLAAAITRLIDHPAMAERMGAAGRIRLRERFSLERLVDESVALYAKATSRRQGTGRRGRTTVGKETNAEVAN